MFRVKKAEKETNAGEARKASLRREIKYFKLFEQKERLIKH